MTSAATNNRPRILVADDQAAVRDAMRLLLKGEGYAVTLVPSPAEALAAVQASAFGLVLIDLNYTRDTTSGREGLELLDRLLAQEDAPPVVVMTAWATVDIAVEAMRRGARDFIQKPWENPRVLATVRTQLELSGVRRHNARLESENHFLRRDCEDGGRPAPPCVPCSTRFPAWGHRTLPCSSRAKTALAKASSRALCMPPARGPPSPWSASTWAA